MTIAFEVIATILQAIDSFFKTEFDFGILSFNFYDLFFLCAGITIAFLIIKTFIGGD